jgi:hypothetical protein
MMEAARTSETSDNYFTPDDGGSTSLKRRSTIILHLVMEAARTSETSDDNYFTPDDGGSTYL